MNSGIMLVEPADQHWFRWWVCLYKVSKAYLNPKRESNIAVCQSLDLVAVLFVFLLLFFFFFHLVILQLKHFLSLSSNMSAFVHLHCMQDRQISNLQKRETFIFFFFFFNASVQLAGNYKDTAFLARSTGTCWKSYLKNYCSHHI